MQRDILDVPTFVSNKIRTREYAVINSHAFWLSLCRIKKVLGPKERLFTVWYGDYVVFGNYRDMSVPLPKTTCCVKFIKSAIFNELTLYGKLDRKHFKLFIKDPAIVQLIIEHLKKYKSTLQGMHKK
jgi:hypothetical protein